MDGADPPSAAGDDESGVLGRLPATRPQHRSSRRDGRPKKVAAPTRPTSRAPRRRSSAAPADAGAAPSTLPREASTTGDAPSVPAPPAAPRSGWATPDPHGSPAAPLPPLAAAVDGAVRSGERLVRSLVRRLPFG